VVFLSVVCLITGGYVTAGDAFLAGLAIETLDSSSSKVFFLAILLFLFIPGFETFEETSTVRED